MNRFVSLVFVFSLAAAPFQAHAQYVDCKPLFHFDKSAQQLTYTALVPSQTFAVRMSPYRAGRLDTVIIGFGITKTPATKTISDTIIIKILEDTLPTQSLIGSYIFAVPPDISGNINTMNWIMELNFFTGEGPIINPARDFWITWKFSGPSADRASVLLRKAATETGRSVVLASNGTTTPMTTVAWSQVGDTVDLQLEARMCYLPIPVELSSFRGSYVDGKTWLDWSTASETNNFGFEIERLDARSEDGAISMWRKLAFVVGNGTTTEDRYYSYIDADPAPAMLDDGTFRYRLRQIDFDGTYDLSPILAVNVTGLPEGAALAPLYPNPVTAVQDVVTIPFRVAVEQDIRIEVRNILGAVVAVPFEGRARTGRHSVTYQTADLNPGWYSCTLHAGGTAATQRFMVLR